MPLQTTSRASTGYNFKWEHFDVLAGGLRIKETLLIRDMKPAVNDNVGSKNFIFIIFSSSVFRHLSVLLLFEFEFSRYFYFKTLPKPRVGLGVRVRFFYLYKKININEMKY